MTTYTTTLTVKQHNRLLIKANKAAEKKMKSDARAAEKATKQLERNAEKKMKSDARAAEKATKQLDRNVEKSARVAMLTEERFQRRLQKEADRIDKFYNTISKEDIIHFKETSNRSGNDDANDKRENATIMMLNNRVPQEFSEYDPMWTIISQQARDRIHSVITSDGTTLANHVVFIKAGGRGKHYDIEMSGDGEVQLKIEFKYGAGDVVETPQFVSPMKPSQYMTASFEEHYYQKYLPTIMENFPHLTIPEKDIYMKQIHGNKPECMKELQKKYYAGSTTSSQYTGNEEDRKFYKKCKDTSQEAIKEFISRDDVTLRHEALSEYIVGTQEKVYLMYKNGQFTTQRIDPTEFVIESYVKEPEKSMFVVITKTGRKLYILLRWKNGNGVAFPAFQISLHT